VTSSVRIGSSTNSSKWPPKIPENDSLLGELLFRSETCNTAPPSIRGAAARESAAVETPYANAPTNRLRVIIPIILLHWSKVSVSAVISQH